MKKLLLCGAVALSLVGVMLVAYRDNRGSQVVISYDNDRYYNRRYHRGPVEATVDGATNVARGTGHAIGHGLKNIFGGGHDHRGYYDAEGNFHR